MYSASHFTEWRPPPEVLWLAEGGVHVWRFSLDQPDSYVAEILSVLDSDERKRAESFYFLKHRKHFIVSHGILRTLLGQYLDIKPAELRFSYNLFGKPALELGSDKPAVRFNMSHSHGLALFAFALRREVGVDLERVQSDFASEEIAERFFSQAEVVQLRALDYEQVPEAFFNCWTRKEAYIKARGDGLSCPLDSFTVSLVPGEPASLLRVEGDAGEASRWSLQDLKVGPGFVGAVVVEKHVCQLMCYEWTGYPPRNRHTTL
jgi:4'-phosphopantetheinyl transferase